MKNGPSRFHGLSNRLEFCKVANILINSNLAVEHGLVNGTQGHVKDIVFAHGHNPNHEVPTRRMPEIIVVDCPKYTGPSFWDEDEFPERKTWIPLRPKEVQDPAQKHISRIQFPLILAWALTPWKAQGMTLDLAKIQLGNAAVEPGAAFTALSRVRHPDHLTSYSTTTFQQ